MRNYFLLLFVTLFISCDSEDVFFEVGKQFIETNINIIETDTLKLDVSTIISDSLITSSATRLLIGKYNDHEFGDLSAQTYFGLTTGLYDIDNAAILDSIALLLFYDGYYFGDTTQILTYKVHEIIEQFEPKDDDYNFYNTSSLNLAEEAIGSLTFTPYPNKKDSISIPLNYEFGLNIFEKLQNDEIENLEDFRSEFRGVSISAESDNNTVLGYQYSGDSSNTVIRFYYTLKEDDNSENNQYEMDFSLEGGTKIFNRITSDRTGTLIENLTSSEEKIPSEECLNKVYLQSGTGISARVEFPTLRNLIDLKGKSEILEATLRIYPEFHQNQSDELVESLAVYLIDKKNRGLGALNTLDGESAMAILHNSEDEFHDEIYYEIDVSYFVDLLVTNDYALDYALRIEFPDNANTINKMLLHDELSPENSGYKMKLNVTYLNY